MAITDRQTRSRDEFADWVEALAECGVDAVQVRNKAVDDRTLFELAECAVAAARGRLQVLVNGRLDIALGAGADGVHLPGDGVPTALLRRCFGQEAIIGRSTHRLEEVARAEDEGADYVTFGPVWETPSKRRFGAPAGLDPLKAAVRLGIPVLGLGGAHPARFAALAAAGAAGAAGIRMLEERSRIEEAAAVARTTWPRSL